MAKIFLEPKTTIPLNMQTIIEIKTKITWKMLYSKRKRLV